MKTLKLPALLFLSIHLTAQRYDPKKFAQDSAELMKIKLVRPQVKFDNRLTFINGQSTSINGFDAGVLLKDKMRLTLGYYNLSESLNLPPTKSDEEIFLRRIKIDYGTINSEIIYLDKRYFSMGLPLELGFGFSTLKSRSAINKDVNDSQKGFLALAHFGLSATFKPIRWIGLKGIIGYRKTILNQIKDLPFDGLFTSLGLNVDFREIIRDFKMMKLKKRYGRGHPIENAVDLITD